MNVILDGLLRINEVSDEVLNTIKAELTMKNPEYIRKKAMGLNRYTWGPEYIQQWNERDINGNKEYILPRGYYARLWELTKGDFSLLDMRTAYEKMNYPQNPALRDYQEPVLKAVEDWQSGVVIMPCGAGKTNAGQSAIAYLGQPTLWITHTMDLLEQSMERAKSWLGLKGSQIGVIQGDNYSIGSHITFATVQTLAKRDLAEIKNKFGCIVIDECHLVFKDASKARMFESVISQFPAAYRIGLTASEFRSDGLISTMFNVIGPKIYEIEQNDPRLPTVKPTVKFIRTDFNYIIPEDERLNVQQLYAAIREDVEREYIITRLLDTEVFEGDYCIVLGDSLEHLSSLQNYVLANLNRKTAFLHGKTPKKERNKIMSDMRAGKYQYLFATYQLAKLGLDIPHLNKLFLATPKKDRTSIQQAVGRVMRPAEGKNEPVVYDIWDGNVSQLRYWAKERIKVYENLGCTIIGGPVTRRKKA